MVLKLNIKHADDDSWLGPRVHTHAWRSERIFHLALSLFLSIDTVCRQAGSPWLFRQCCVDSVILQPRIQKHIHFLRRRRRVFVLRASTDHTVHHRALQWRCRRLGARGTLSHDVSSISRRIFVIFSRIPAHLGAVSTSAAVDGVVGAVYTIMRRHDVFALCHKFRSSLYRPSVLSRTRSLPYWTYLLVSRASFIYLLWKKF